MRSPKVFKPRDETVPISLIFLNSVKTSLDPNVLLKTVPPCCLGWSLLLSSSGPRGLGLLAYAPSFGA